MTLSAEGGVLKSLDLETKLSVLTLGASLGYANPGESMESGHASDKTVNVAERVNARARRFAGAASTDIKRARRRRLSIP